MPAHHHSLCTLQPKVAGHLSPCSVHGLRRAELQHVAAAEEPCFARWPGQLASTPAVPAAQSKRVMLATHIQGLGILLCTYIWLVQSQVHLYM